MQDIRKSISKQLKKIVKELYGEEVEPDISHPSLEKFGDYSSNIAMAIFSSSKFKVLASRRSGQNSKLNSPLELAKEIANLLNTKYIIHNTEKVEVAPPGFINFWVSKEYLLSSLSPKDDEKIVSSKLKDQRIMVEFAHPNTHKEMHIGHMRTLITGEAISRLLEEVGAKVFRANYQGDIGPHVAKAIYGVQKLFQEEKLSLEEIEKWLDKERAHFLGKAYVRGNQDYKDHKEEIDSLNNKLYGKSEGIWPLYEKTRKWSLNYYDEFYKRFYTKFDRLFFESEVSERAKEIVLKNVGKVFQKDQGAVIFDGEPFKLHKRVFVTSQENPTYEGKDMGLGYFEYEAFAFDLNIHVVANEQAGYFQVVFKALELIDPEKFKDKEFHLSMGMVQLKDPSASSGQVRKISSRTGEVLTVDWLIDEVKKKVEELLKEGKIESGEKENLLEQITIGAIKYSVLQVGTTQNVSFDINKSVSLDGNSGPYIQYTYARTRSVLAKANEYPISNVKYPMSNFQLTNEEEVLLRSLARFDEIVVEAGESYAPNLLAGYLFDLAQKLNLFYQKCPILKGEEDVRSFRIALTTATGKILKKGLYLLGIQAPEKM